MVYKFSAHLLLWVRNLKSQLFFEMQRVTKIECQNKVCNSFNYTQRKFKCVINEEIVAIATKRINVNPLPRKKNNKNQKPSKFQPARMLRLNSSSIIVIIIEAKTQCSNFYTIFYIDL